MYLRPRRPQWPLSELSWCRATPPPSVPHRPGPFSTTVEHLSPLHKQVPGPSAIGNPTQQARRAHPRSRGWCSRFHRRGVQWVPRGAWVRVIAGIPPPVASPQKVPRRRCMPRLRDVFPWAYTKGGPGARPRPRRGDTPGFQCSRPDPKHPRHPESAARASLGPTRTGGRGVVPVANGHVGPPVRSGHPGGSPGASAFLGGQGSNTILLGAGAFRFDPWSSGLYCSAYQSSCFVCKLFWPPTRNRVS